MLKLAMRFWILPIGTATTIVVLSWFVGNWLHKWSRATPEPQAESSDTMCVNAAVAQQLLTDFENCVDQLQKCYLTNRVYNGGILAGEERIIACRELREHGVITESPPSTGWARSGEGCVFIVDNKIVGPAECPASDGIWTQTEIEMR